MVLSKDDSAEKPKTPVITASRKRRERRKKLHAAKENISNSFLKKDTEKNNADSNAVADVGPSSENSIEKHIEQANQSSKASCKDQKFTCPVIEKSHKNKEVALVNNIENQESQSDNKKTLYKTKTSKTKSPVENEKNQCKCDQPNKKQKSKGKNLISTQNQNTKSDNQVSTENQIINSEKSVLIQDLIRKTEIPALPASQIDKSDRTLLTDSQKAQSEKDSFTDNLKINTVKVDLLENQNTKDFNLVVNESQKAESKKIKEKQVICPVNPLNQNEVSKLDNIPVLNKNNKIKLESSITTIDDYKSGTEYHISVVDQETKSEKSNQINNHILTPEAIKFENQVSESQNSNCLIEKVISSSQDMGKSQDSQHSKSQSESSSKCSKTEEVSPNDTSAKSREDIKAAREAKKLAKLKAKKKGDDTVDNVMVSKEDKSSKVDIKAPLAKDNTPQKIIESPNKTEKIINSEIKDVLVSKGTTPSPAETRVKEGKIPATKPKEKVEIETTDVKTEEGGKSKAELRAERRAKQEAQRAAKQAATQAKASQPTKPEVKQEPVKSKEEKTAKTKPVEKSKPKAQSVQKVGWFQHLHSYTSKESLNKIAVNSNLHPAVIKLGVQLASHVVSGSNARCIALLNALKKMVRDYSLPARTEFARGLESQLTASVEFLSSMRQPTASETNALKYFRRQLTQLPNNVDEFDAKKKLQEEIDRYIREQIDMAGEAISIIVRKKISTGDNILTYGCSSLIERILCEAWEAGVKFQAIVAGTRVHNGAREMLRRLLARGVPTTYVDYAALSYVMSDVQKVVVGAGALLANGAALGAAGGAGVALLARARNVPLLVAAETHKFSDRVHTDAFLYNEIGDPDDLIDKTDENSPLKDWRSNPNLTLLNPIYDVTPPSLITAVVTELGILPCTSAPVVLRFKQSEYGM